MNTAVKAVIVLVVIAVVGGIAYGIMASRGVFEPEHESNVTSVQGEVSCLPLKDGTTPTKDCQLGLRNSRGLFIELQDTTQSELAAGKRIEVTGVLTAALAKSKYSTVGVMKVQKQSQL